MVVRKTYFMLMVKDMDRAIAFWERALDLKADLRTPDWSELRSGGAIVALHGGRRDGTTTETGLGFEVDDIEAACVRVREAGGSIVAPPKQQEYVDLKLATVADPDGNAFSIAQTG